LQLPAGGGGATPIHAMGITGLAVAGQPFAHVGSAVLFVLQNLGTFTESNVPYTVTVNGSALFSGSTGTLPPGGSIEVSTQWTPSQSGTALVAASLAFAGASQARTTANITVIVDQEPALTTTVAGTVRRNGDGTFVLVDAGGRPVAALTPEGGSRVDLTSFVGQHVTATGALAKTGDGYLFTVRSINTTK
jgi:hypothetical protein